MANLGVLFCFLFVAATARVIQDDIGRLLRVPKEDQRIDYPAEHGIQDDDKLESLKSQQEEDVLSLREEKDVPETPDVKKDSDLSHTDFISEAIKSDEASDESTRRDYLALNMDRLKRLLTQDYLSQVRVNDFSHRRDYILQNAGRLAHLIREDYGKYREQLASRRQKDLIKVPADAVEKTSTTDADIEDALLAKEEEKEELADSSVKEVGEKDALADIEAAGVKEDENNKRGITVLKPVHVGPPTGHGPQAGPSSITASADSVEKSSTSDAETEDVALLAKEEEKVDLADASMQKVEEKDAPDAKIETPDEKDDSDISSKDFISEAIKSDEASDESTRRDYLALNMDRLKQLVMEDYQSQVPVYDYAHRRDYILQNADRLAHLIREDYGAYRKQLAGADTVEKTSTADAETEEAALLAKEEEKEDLADASMQKVEEKHFPDAKKAVADVKEDLILNNFDPVSDILKSDEASDASTRRDYIASNMERLKRLIAEDYKRLVGVDDSAHRLDYIKKNADRLADLIRQDYGVYEEKRAEADEAAFLEKEEKEGDLADASLKKVEEKDVPDAKKVASEVKEDTMLSNIDIPPRFIESKEARDEPAHSASNMGSLKRRLTSDYQRFIRKMDVLSDYLKSDEVSDEPDRRGYVASDIERLKQLVTKDYEKLIDMVETKDDIAREDAGAKEDAVTSDETVAKDAVTSDETVAKDAVASDETIAKDAVTPDEVAAKEDAVTPELAVAKEDIVTPDEVVAKEDIVTPDEAVAKEDTVTSDEVVVKEDIVTSDEAVPKEDTVTPDEAVAKEDAVTPDEAVAKEDAVTPDEDVTKGVVSRSEAELKKDTYEKDDDAPAKPVEEEDKTRPAENDEKNFRKFLTALDSLRKSYKDFSDARHKSPRMPSLEKADAALERNEIRRMWNNDLTNDEQDRLEGKKIENKDFTSSGKEGRIRPQRSYANLFSDERELGEPEVA